VRFDGQQALFYQYRLAPKSSAYNLRLPGQTANEWASPPLLSQGGGESVGPPDPKLSCPRSYLGGDSVLAIAPRQSNFRRVQGQNFALRLVRNSDNLRLGGRN
jgi:hypothetical protein